MTLSSDVSSGASHVAIVMGVCNGAATLLEQLDSIAGQSHCNWSLLIGDDGSSDGGGEIIADFGRRHPRREISVFPGPCRGFSVNYLTLLQRVDRECQFVALSDQDDIWLPNKLDRAVAALRTVPAGVPALYGSRSWVWNPARGVMRLSPAFYRMPCFENALVQNISGGNTMVLNRAALDLIQELECEIGPIISHDWWLYQIISGAGGVVIYDHEPTLLYRQHTGNLIGENRSFAARLSRGASVLSGRYRGWMAANISALSNAQHILTPENRRILYQFRDLRRGGVQQRIRHFRQLGLHRQTRGETAVLWGAWIAGLV